MRFRSLKYLSQRVGLYLLLAFFVLVATFPLYWMVICSIQPLSDLFDYPPNLFPRNVLLTHYRDLLFNTSFPRYFLNSLIVAFTTTAVAVTIACLGGYSLSRFDYKGKRILVIAILLCYMLPPVVLGIPLFLFFHTLKLIDTLLAVIIASVSFTLPFGLWLLWAYFNDIPLELEEACMVDGGTRFLSFIYVVIPMAFPGVLAISIFNFIVVWNNYIFPFLFISSQDKMTLPIGLSYFFEATANQWGYIMSGSVLMTAPILVLSIQTLKYLIKGFNVGGVKG